MKKAVNVILLLLPLLFLSCNQEEITKGIKNSLNLSSDNVLVFESFEEIKKIINGENFERDIEELRTKGFVPLSSKYKMWRKTYSENNLLPEDARSYFIEEKNNWPVFINEGFALISNEDGIFRVKDFYYRFTKNLAGRSKNLKSLKNNFEKNLNISKEPQTIKDIQYSGNKTIKHANEKSLADHETWNHDCQDDGTHLLWGEIVSNLWQFGSGPDFDFVSSTQLNAVLNSGSCGSGSFPKMTGGTITANVQCNVYLFTILWTDATTSGSVTKNNSSPYYPVVFPLEYTEWEGTGATLRYLLNSYYVYATTPASTTLEIDKVDYEVFLYSD